VTIYSEHIGNFRTEGILDRFEPAPLIVEVADVVVHEGDEPDALGHLGDADLLPGTWLKLILRALQQMRPQLVTITVASENGYVSSSRPRYTRGDRVYRSAGTFMSNAWCGRSRL
jgi:hypothetical protein